MAFVGTGRGHHPRELKAIGARAYAAAIARWPRRTRATTEANAMARTPSEPKATRAKTHVAVAA